MAHMVLVAKWAVVDRHVSPILPAIELVDSHAPRGAVAISDFPLTGFAPDVALTGHFNQV